MAYRTSRERRREVGGEGGKMELEEVKFRTEGWKIRAKGNLKRKIGRGRDRGGYHSGP